MIPPPKRASESGPPQRPPLRWGWCLAGALCALIAAVGTLADLVTIGGHHPLDRRSPAEAKSEEPRRVGADRPGPVPLDPAGSPHGPAAPRPTSGAASAG